MSNEFTFNYDATTGVLIAAALRAQADDEAKAADGNRLNAALGTKLTEFYEEQAQTCQNRAALLRSAADSIAKPIRAALASDMGEALRKAGIVE